MFVTFSFKKTNYRIIQSQSFQFPNMFKVKQIFPRPTVNNLRDAVKEELEKFCPSSIKGKRIAITAGSRDIKNIAEIIQTIGVVLKGKGALPFVVNAMGSHGGASAQGQRKVLSEYGIVEKMIKMPVCCSMQTVQIGCVNKEIPVFFDKFAMNADGVIVCGRVKPHTDFHAEIESGICKMMAIGLGKHKGASTIHQQGIHNFEWLIPEVASLVIKQTPILGAIAIVENAYHDTARIVGWEPEAIIEEEKRLLMESKKLMAQIYCKEFDVLIIDEIGKDISGAGMDPNIVGRSCTGMPGFDSIKASSIVVLGLSKKTGGHATGIGMADVTTLKVANKIDFGKLYTNSITSVCPMGGKLPIILNNDRDAILFSIKAANAVPTDQAKVIHIKNTSDIEKIEVSESLLQHVEDSENLKLLSSGKRMKFDEKMQLISFDDFE